MTQTNPSLALLPFGGSFKRFSPTGMKSPEHNIVTGHPPAYAVVSSPTILHQPSALNGKQPAVFPRTSQTIVNPSCFPFGKLEIGVLCSAALMPTLAPMLRETHIFRIRVTSDHKRHTVDGRNPAPPKKPWNDDSPANTNKQ